MMIRFFCLKAKLLKQNKTVSNSTIEQTMKPSYFQKLSRQFMVLFAKDYCMVIVLFKFQHQCYAKFSALLFEVGLNLLHFLLYLLNYQMIRPASNFSKNCFFCTISRANVIVFFNYGIILEQVEQWNQPMNQQIRQ